MATERTEAAVLDELAKHCVEPGFIHALAHLCLRDNVLKVEGELKPDQLESSYGAARLIRSEISTLIALMARQPIDASDIDAERLQQLMSKTEALLEELHWAMTIPWREAVGDLANLPGSAPFASGLSMREPIFYAAESAYAFQYRDLARQKYAADDAWLLANKGFRIDEACTIAHAMTGLISMRQTIGYWRRWPRSFPGNTTASWTRPSTRSGLPAERLRRLLRDAPTWGATCLVPAAAVASSRSAAATRLSDGMVWERCVIRCCEHAVSAEIEIKKLILE